MRHPLRDFSILLLVSCLAAFAGAAERRPAPPAETRPAYEEILKIDVHSHVFEDLPQLNALMRSVNVRTVNVCNNGTDGHLEQMHQIALEQYRRHPDLYPFEATFDLLRRDEPAYIHEVTSFLDRMFQQGAVGVKIWKEVGIDIKNRAGKFILPDDPLFDPIYAHIAKRGKILHAHLAEPIDAWRPLDPNSPHYHYYSTNPEWHLYGKPQYPSHEAIIAARDRIMEKHPTLVVLGAHLGSLEHDLDGIVERLKRYPNFNIEVAARTRNLTRHPSEKVRALFLEYPDRILYGVDASWKPFLGRPASETARQAHLKRLELQYRADFDYYAGEGEVTYSGRKVQALNLPRPVLEKFYHANAERLFRLPAAWSAKPGG
ncbi:MAG: amidohydrolase family protein [Opitutaceae bacterium]|nr:amidohydrolase family protein [Opitutaceae bacterium]